MMAFGSLSSDLCVLKAEELLLLKRFEIMKKNYLSKALLEMAGRW